jgi:hypothetical protein
MKLKLKDEYIDQDQLFGPLPNFKDSFEKFFIQKAANSLFDFNLNKSEINQIDQEDSQSNIEFVVNFFSIFVIMKLLI